MSAETMRIRVASVLSDGQVPVWLQRLRPRARKQLACAGPWEQVCADQVAEGSQCAEVVSSEHGQDVVEQWRGEEDSQR